MTKKTILINETDDETRVAIVEDNLLQEMLFEHRTVEQTKNNIYASLLEATNQLCRLANDSNAAMPYRMGWYDTSLIEETGPMLTTILEEMESNEQERQKLWSCYHSQLVNFLLFMRFRVWDMQPGSEVIKQFDTVIEQIETTRERYNLEPVAWAHVHFRASPLHDDKPQLKEKFQRIRVLLK